MITGGTGFVGSHLCDELIKDKHEVIVLARNDSKKDNILQNYDKIQLEYVDVTDFPKLEYSIEQNKPDVIFHLAGETSHKRSFENPMYDADVNSKSTLCILEKIKNLNLNCKFILGSTFVVIGKPQKLPVNEESVCNPTTIYGANRLTSENYCKIYNNVYNLDTYVFRITNSFGPREQIIPSKNAINYLIHNAFNGDEVTIYNEGKFFRDLIYISDVISGIKSIMTNGKSGETYWISSGKETWFYELAQILQELCDAKIKYTNPPQYTQKVDVGNFIVDNSKLRSLGWSPKISVKEGISQTLKYFNSKI